MSLHFNPWSCSFLREKLVKFLFFFLTEDVKCCQLSLASYWRPHRPEKEFRNSVSFFFRSFCISISSVFGICFRWNAPQKCFFFNSFESWGKRLEGNRVEKRHKSRSFDMLRRNDAETQINQFSCINIRSTSPRRRKMTQSHATARRVGSSPFGSSLEGEKEWEGEKNPRRVKSRL